MNRKKPTGQTWEEFSGKWSQLPHAGKVALASDYGVSYGTARHWICEGKTDPVKTTAAAINDTAPVELPIEQELFAIPYRTELDFVTFDIETTSLKADFSIILSAAVKPFKRDPVVFRADTYPTWRTARDDDSGIVRDISQELARHAIVITHYGSKFDLPYLRAKAMRYGCPALPPMFGIDTYYIAKANFLVSSRRLENLCRYFGLGQKSGVEGNLWNKAAFAGDKEAMDAIVKHNCQDVELLERLASMSFSYLKSLPKA